MFSSDDGGGTVQVDGLQSHAAVEVDALGMRCRPDKNGHS